MPRPALRVTLLLLLLALPAQAHPFLQDSMWVLFSPERIRVAVNVSLKEILVAQGIEAQEEAGFDSAQVQAAAEKHRVYLPSHLHLAVAGRELAGKIANVTPPPIYAAAENTFYQYEIEYPLAPPLPAEVAFRHDVLREFSYAPGQPWELSYLVRVKREGSDEVTSWMLRPNQSSALPTGWTAPPAAASLPSGHTRIPLPPGGAVLGLLCGAGLWVAYRRARLSPR